MTEQKIASFQYDKIRLQLLEITYEDLGIVKYQVRLNRKVIKTSISEYAMSKLFANYVLDTVLQLKII